MAPVTIPHYNNQLEEEGNTRLYNAYYSEYKQYPILSAYKHIRSTSLLSMYKLIHLYILVAIEREMAEGWGPASIVSNRRVS